MFLCFASVNRKDLKSVRFQHEDALGGELLPRREVGSQRQPTGTEIPELSPGSKCESQCVPWLDCSFLMYKMKGSGLLVSASNPLSWLDPVILDIKLGFSSALN